MLLLAFALAAPPPSRAQGVDVYINITSGGTKKLNIAIPELTVTTGADPAATGKLLARIAGADLTFSGLFRAVAPTGASPADNAAALKQSWTDFAAAGAHAGVHGLLALRGSRIDGEMRLYDLTSPEFRLIASKKFEVPPDQSRRLAHKIADEVVLQFTGEPGVADTKIAYVAGRPGAKEILVADYDGAGAAPATRNGSITFTSFMNGYPDLFRMFPFEPQRPVQTLAAFAGINSSPAWSPDGRLLALTLSLHGNPEIYVLTVATG